ncbi:MAG: gliding motility-associated C-terminal domain-containing protein [Bacteroidota bacterium]
MLITGIDKVDQLDCNNNASAFVTAITIGSSEDKVLDPADYSFTWSTDGNVVVNNVAGAKLLDKTLFPTINQGNYVVKAVRTSGKAPASGCDSAPVSIQIIDKSTNPLADLSFTPNSACNVNLPNGQMVASAKEQSGATSGPYTFAWTVNPNDALAPAFTQADVGNVSTLNQATDGKYQVIVTNSTTGCKFTGTREVTVDKSLSQPTILDFTKFNPTSCDGDGRITITSVKIGNNLPRNGADAAFSYEWSVVTGTGTALIPGQSGAELKPIVAGTYFVSIVDNTTDCKATPTQIELQQGPTIFPVVFIDLSARDISCTAVGTAALAANVDGQPTPAAPYEFNWFTTLDGSGTAIPLENTYQLDGLSQGNYSVAVEDTNTGCVTTAFFIVEDESPLGTPAAAFNSTTVTDCLTPNGTITTNVIGLKDVILGSKDYPFTTFNFSAELFAGASASGAPLESSMNQPVTGSFASAGNLNFGTYTVRITDINTGCLGIKSGELKDGRVLPEVFIREDNPQTSCLVNNGQLTATADAFSNPLNPPGGPVIGQVAGYTFTWFAGTVVTGASIGNNNVLFGQKEGSYTVEVINNATNCKASKSGLIIKVPDVPSADPEPEVISDVTTCQPEFPPDGSATVSVGGETLGYKFSWYDQSKVVAGTPVVSIDRVNLNAGFYTVTASKLSSGCPGNPKTIEILDKRIIPILEATVEPSYCSDTGRKPTGSILLTTTNPEAIIDEVTWTLLQDDKNTPVNEDIKNESGVQLFQQLPGFYKAVVTTPQGCKGDLEIKIPSEIGPYNGISKNGDGLNDGFIIDCISLFPNNNVKIFNRSGVKVYEADGYDNNQIIFNGVGINGLYLQGNELPEGTYFYVIDKRDGSIPVAGYLEIIR